MTATEILNAQAPTIVCPSISSSAMFVELSIKQWTGRKLDKKATSDVTASNGANANVASVHKKLLGDCNTLEKVAKFVANVRNANYHSTMPWSDLGMRLLPTSMYADYHKQFTEYEQEFTGLVNDFLQEYSWAQAQAQTQLVGLYNADDYPTVEALASKFSFKIGYQLIPDVSNDFRLKTAQDANAYLQEQLSSHFEQQLKDAMGDVWQRTYKVLANMSERLDYAGKDDKKKFNDTLVGNVKDMVNLLTKFNITGDAKMESMRVALDDAMFGISPDALRHDDVLRAETKGKVDAILSAMAW